MTRTNVAVTIGAAVAIVVAVTVAFISFSRPRIEFFDTSELTYVPPPSGIDLIGGTEADPKNYATIFYSRHGKERGGHAEYCTAALVGPDALLTAAHCLEVDGKINTDVAIMHDSTRIKGTCTAAPVRQKNLSVDLALCKMDDSIKDVIYESINLNGALVKAGTQLLLMGFGCNNEAGSAESPAVFRVGLANVIGVSDKRCNSIVTEGDIALCFGDSGGPAFVVRNGNGPERGALVAVNSSGNICDISILASASTGFAQDFFRSWTKTNRTAICGYGLEQGKCR